MVAERVVAASRYGDGTVEIPQLENVGFDMMRKQFDDDETEIKRGVLMLLDKKHSSKLTKKKLHVSQSCSRNTKIVCPTSKFVSYPHSNIHMLSVGHTTLDVLQECRIDDYWNVEGDRILSK